MTAIPAGGFLDLPINTERVLNSTQNLPHWMRFTLSERRVAQPPSGALPDGRGPSPSSAIGSYSFGETEDMLQLPPPAGAPGDLELQKRVITTASPTEWIDYVTYEITLRHVGGSQPVQAQIRDELPYPLIVYPTFDASGVHYVVVTSPGGAAPLAAALDVVPPSGTTPPQQVVSWDGTLAPNAEVTLRFQVRVIALCEPNQQTMTFTNTAKAKPDGGATITAQDSFVAKCLGYDEKNITAELNPQIGQIDQIDFQDVPLHYTLTNSHAFSVTLGLAQERVNASQVNAIDATPFQQVVTLGPGERKVIEIVLGMEAEDTDELTAPDESTVESRLKFCFVVDQDLGCPDMARYPQLTGQGPLVTVKVRPHDLGDAPDSTNHAGVAMAAYPGIQASFPTVFDPAAGLPQGPQHAHPRPLHLGPQVSLEAEADLGPDQDPSNNIVPAANQPNRDRFDDGSRLNTPANCQTTTADVRVAITPAAWNWFKANGQPAYLNVWADSNRDGDWADGFTCAGPDGQQADVVEHIVIDFPIDVITLGPGLHSISVPTARVARPAQFAQRPAWVRFTLSERPSNKPLTYQGISYGDGRGYATPFRLGETEDHILMPKGVDGGGAPDLAVSLKGRITGGRIAFSIEYSNQGTAPASGATLSLTLPAQLGDKEPALLRAPGIDTASITHANGKISIPLPQVTDGTSNTIMLGWDLPAPAATLSAALAASYLAGAQVALAGDTNSANDSASVTVETPRRAPIVAAVTGDGNTWGQRETTCRSSVTLVGRGEPNSIIAILIGLLTTKTVTTDASGAFRIEIGNLPTGRSHIQVQYDSIIVSPRDPNTGQPSGLWLDVDPSLPFDPISLSFTDSKGRSYHPPTLGWASAETNFGAALRAGETYQIGVNSCASDPSQSFNVIFEDILVSSLYDDDGDGRYLGEFNSGSVLRANLAAAGELRLDVTSGGATRGFAMALGAAGAGIVTDSQSGQSIAGANVAALISGGDLWPAAALGAANPQASDAGGSYGFGAASDTSRLAASHSGYQPYRSWEIDGAALDQPIRLTPELSGTPDATIYITESGFDPPLLKVRPGALVEWVNLDLAEHTATGTSWDSGALATGGSYRARVGLSGSYSYTDAARPLTAGTLFIDGGFNVYLPLVWR
jgi:hypothetical protein